VCNFFKKTTTMKIGDVFSFSENRTRILMFDDKEIFYGTVGENDNFVYSKYKTMRYYRTSREYFNENSSFIKSLKLTEKELQIHRPDLPLRLNCFTSVFWTNDSLEKEIDYLSFLKTGGISKDELEGLDNSKVVIIPNSQQQSNKKPILLVNKNGSFSGQEIMKSTLRIQREYVKVDKPYFSRLKKDTKGLSGIGMYRLGIIGNVPSYYLGGEMSMMEWESRSFLLEEKELHTIT